MTPVSSTIVISAVRAGWSPYVTIVGRVVPARMLKPAPRAVQPYGPDGNGLGLAKYEPGESDVNVDTPSLAPSAASQAVATNAGTGVSVNTPMHAPASSSKIETPPIGRAVVPSASRQV